MINIFLRLWRRCYVFILPTLSVILVIILHIYKKDIVESKNFEEVLKSVITFISITIGLFSVLLTSLLTIKGKSSLLDFFLDNSDIECFTRNIKYNIMTGLLSVIFSVILFLNDLFPNCVTFIIICLWVWFLISYVFSSYRFISIMLRLFFANKKSSEIKTINNYDDNKFEKLKNKLNNK